MSLISRLSLRAAGASNCFQLTRSINIKPMVYNVSQQLIAKRLKASSLLTRRVLSSNSAASTHDHPKIWMLEKVMSAALLGVIPAAFLVPNPLLDYALALSLVVHVHWGLEAIVVDYVRAKLFGPFIPKVALLALYLLSISALAGLFYLNYSDVGLSTGIKMLWRSL